MKNLPAVINGAQRLFVRELIETGDAIEAARRCKLNSSDAADMARNPLIIKEIRREVLSRLHVDILPRIIKAVDDLSKNINKDDESDPTRRYNITKTKLDFVKLVFERTGIGAAKDSDHSRDLAEMSLDELHALVGRLEAERSAAAKPVNAQGLEPSTDQALDFME